MRFDKPYFRIRECSMPILPNTKNNDPAEMWYTPGKVAKILDISVETLRLYEREGLIIPFKAASGHRRFTQQDMDWIRMIRKQIHTHKLNFAGLRYLLSMLPCWEVKDCCLGENYTDCPAKQVNDKPCWMVEGTPCKAKGENCRDCPIYAMAYEVDKFKEKLSVKLR